VRILIDTNVVLDVLMARQPHLDHALAVVALVDARRVSGVLGATTLTTIFYLLAKAVGVADAHAHLRSLLDLFDVAAVDRAVLIGALDAGFEDFEDGVLHQAATLAGVDAIVTRDVAGFAAASLPVFTPAAFLATVRGAGG
jgi:predicted nucleic acid-binding protein